MKDASPGLSFRSAPDALSFWIHVTPRARRNAVGGIHGDALRVQVTAIPSGGAANRACQIALASALGVPRSAIDLDPGSKGRRKRVRILGDAGPLRQRLTTLAAGNPSAP